MFEKNCSLINPQSIVLITYSTPSTVERQKGRFTMKRYQTTETKKVTVEDFVTRTIAKILAHKRENHPEWKNVNYIITNRTDVLPGTGLTFNEAFDKVFGTDKDGRLTIMNKLIEDGIISGFPTAGGYKVKIGKKSVAAENVSKDQILSEILG